MISHRHSTSHTLALSYTPVLLESRRSLDGRLIRSRCLQNVVHRTIGSDVSFLGCCRRGVVGPVGFDDVVFYQWVRCPAIKGEISVARTGPCSVVDYSPKTKIVRTLQVMDSEAYFGPPGFHPFPTTKFPLPLPHLTMYLPPSRLL